MPIRTYIENHMGTWKKILRSVQPNPGIAGKGKRKASMRAEVTPSVAIAPETRIKRNNGFPPIFVL
jgi:hypothetical protein